MEERGVDGDSEGKQRESAVIVKEERGVLVVIPEKEEKGKKRS